MAQTGFSETSHPHLIKVRPIPGAGLPKVCHSDEASWEHRFRQSFVGTPILMKYSGNSCSYIYAG